MRLLQPAAIAAIPISVAPVFVISNTVSKGQFCPNAVIPASPTCVKDFMIRV